MSIVCAAARSLVAVASVFALSGTAPEAFEISFPDLIQADGKERAGRIVLKDAEGDAEYAELTVVGADHPHALTVNGQPLGNRVVRLAILSPPDRQRKGQGMILLKIAATLPQHVRILVVLVDKAGNRSSPVEFSFRARSTLPDLMAALDAAPPEAQVGQELEITATVRNIGGADAGAFRVGAYLSPDGTIKGSDLILGHETVAGLAPDGSIRITFRVQLAGEDLTRARLEPGELYLGVLADDLGQLEEDDGTNNADVRRIRVEAPPKRPARFTVADLSVEPSAPTPGGRVRVRVTIENSGEEPGTQQVEFTIDGRRHDSLILSLGPGERKDVFFTFAVPVAGPHQLTVATQDHRQTVQIRISSPTPVGPLALALPYSDRIRAEIRTDKASYEVGDKAQISYSITAAGERFAYAYVFLVDAAGEVWLIFPSPFSSDPKVVANRDHVLPDKPTYGLRVAEPVGTDALQIIASLSPLDLGLIGVKEPTGGSFLRIAGTAGEAQRLLAPWVRASAEEGRAATAYTEFQVVAAARPTATVTIDRGCGATYRVGDSMTVRYMVTSDATVILVHIAQDGTRQFIVQGKRVQAGMWYAFNATVTLPIGTERLVLEATTDQGIKVTSECRFTIAAVAGSSAGNKPPTARFTDDPATPQVGQWGRFDASGSSDPDRTITGYAWDFGDGTTSNDERPFKRYGQTGSYVVKLTVIDNRGASASVTVTIVVSG